MMLKMRRILYSEIVISIRVWMYNFIENMTGGYFLKKHFKKTNGYSLDLKNPKTFQEKVCWKMVYDRNPLLPLIADKYLLYYYVSHKIGDEKAKKILVRNYNYITSIEELDEIELPNSFIIKSNQGSFRYYVCNDKKDLDFKELKIKVYKWLNSYQDLLMPYWDSKSINKVVIVQKLLGDTDDLPIVEFKLYMLHGRCRLVHFISDRFGDKKNHFLNPNFEKLSSSNKGIDGYASELLDKHKDSMHNLSHKFSEDFDFIRVDFMIHGDNLYLGELTSYPGSIFKNRIPDEFNQKMGEDWILNKNYWK